MAATNDQQLVKALGAHRPNPAFRVRVRIGRLHRRQQHLGALGAEHVVEAAGELRVAVAEQEASCRLVPRAPLAGCGLAE